MHVATALRFPTPPTSPHASNRHDDTRGNTNSSGGLKGRSINTERRRSLLVASQLNAALMQQQQQLASSAVQPHDDIESAKTADALADPETKGEGKEGSRPVAPADQAPSHALEPQHPVDLASQPLRDAIPRVRRNSWIGGGEDTATAAAMTSATAVQSISGPASPAAAANTAVSTTVVEPLQPSTLRWHTPPTSPQYSSHPTSRSGAHPVFATEQAAAKYSRMLRRASWPMQMPQTDELTVQNGNDQSSDDQPSSSSHDDPAAGLPSYRPTPLSTPACTPKGTAAKVLSRFTAPKLAEHDASSGEEDETTQVYEASMESASAIAAAASAAPASSVPALPPSPLVTLLLLGDESCGLGVALDEFAGRDRNIGLTFKTRRVYLPTPRLHPHRKPAEQDEEHKQSPANDSDADSTEEYRVRCWHTPGLRAESIGRGMGRTSFAPYLRSTHAVALVYDVSSEASLAACTRWAECLIAHNEAIAAAAREGGSAPVRPRPVLLVGNSASWTQTRRAAKAGKRGSLRMLPGSRPDAIAAASMSRSARRSSLPHAHTASEVRETDCDSATTDRDVSPSQVQSLLGRLSSAYAAVGFGAVSSVVINANGWKERYRVFHQIADMVREAGTITHSNNHSRPHSPMQRATASDEAAAGE